MRFCSWPAPPGIGEDKVVGVFVVTGDEAHVIAALLNDDLGFFGVDTEAETPEEGDAVVDVFFDELFEVVEIGDFAFVAAGHVYFSATDIAVEEPDEASLEAVINFVQGLGHDFGVGAAIGIGLSDLGELMLVAGNAVVFKEALAGGDDAVTFGALVNHGDAADPDIALVVLGDVFEKVGKFYGGVTGTHGGGQTTADVAGGDAQF